MNPSRWDTWSWVRPRWWELAPEIVLGLGLTYFLVDETHAATSALKSGRAIALMAGVAIAWVLGRLLVARYIRWPAVRLAPFAAAAIAILGVVVAPAYHDHKIVEALRSDRPASLETTSTVAEAGATNAPSTDPVRIRSGSFRGIDHRATGTVGIYRRADGRYVVGLEDFDIQPGPDYDVYVVSGANRKDRDGGTRVDDLRGNSGTQFYDVARGLDLETGSWTVLIWCQTFGVPVANATPS